MAKIHKIKEALNNLEPEFKLPLWNIYCSETNQNLEIYDNDENFFETFYSNNVIGAVQRAVNGEYKFHDDYVRIDNYGNFESFNYEDLDNYIDVDEIAEFLTENEEYLSELMNFEEEEENEVSEEEYYDALEVLPPFYFDTLNGKNVSGGFAVGEPTSHKQTPDGMKATYSGFYKSDGKYFGVGQVYFLNTDSYGEPDGYSDDTREAKTLVPDAFGKGGSIFKSLQDFGNWFMGSRKQYPTGRAWTKEHYNDNDAEDYEVDPAKRKVRARNRKFELGGIPNVDAEVTTGFLPYHRVKSISEAKEYVSNLKSQFPEWDIIVTTSDDVEYYILVRVPANLGKRVFATGGGVGRNKINSLVWTQERKNVVREDGTTVKLDVYTANGKKNKYKIIMNFYKKEYWHSFTDVLFVNGRIKYTYMTGFGVGHLKEDAEKIEQAKKFEDGGEVGNQLIGNQHKIDMNKNGRIDAEDFKILRTSMNGAWRNEHKHVNHSEDYETNYARKKNPARTGYKGRKEYGNGGLTPKEPIAFKTSNLYFNSFGRDINGNSVIRISFPNTRAFSIQLNNGSFKKTYKPFGQSGYGDINEMEINNYVKEFGSETQKKKLKIYK